MSRRADYSEHVNAAYQVVPDFAQFGLPAQVFSQITRFGNAAGQLTVEHVTFAGGGFPIVYVLFFGACLRGRSPAASSEQTSAAYHVVPDFAQFGFPAQVFSQLTRFGNAAGQLTVEQVTFAGGGFPIVNVLFFGAWSRWPLPAASSEQTSVAYQVVPDFSQFGLPAQVFVQLT